MSHPLDTITIASPCQADWNTMQGTEQVRFCQQCQLNVYNLSGMNRTEAETLVQQQEGRLCVRFYQREDGTVLTQDCPVGIKALHRRKLNRWGKLAAAVTLITVVGSFSVASYAEEQNRQLMGKPMMGGAPVMGDMVAPTHTTGQVIQGNMARPIEPGNIKPKKPCKVPKKKGPKAFSFKTGTHNAKAAAP